MAKVAKEEPLIHQKASACVLQRRTRAPSAAGYIEKRRRLGKWSDPTPCLPTSLPFLFLPSRLSPLEGDNSLPAQN